MVVSAGDSFAVDGETVRVMRVVEDRALYQRVSEAGDGELETMACADVAGRLCEWAPGEVGPIAGLGLGGKLQQLLEAVARAGSWAVWMGVFDRGWLGLLQEGGMSYQRARKLTKRLCRVIQDCRAAIAKQRNERQRQATKEKRVAAAAEMAQVITELHGRDDHPRTTLEDLLSGPWRERVSYRRRREHVEREAGKEKERKRLWQETQRQRRQLKRKERARQQLVREKRIKVGVQPGIAAALGGVAGGAEAGRLIEERMAENEGAGSETEAEDGTGARSNLDPEAEQRVQEAVVLAQQVEARQAALRRLAQERGARQRQAARKRRVGGGRRGHRGVRRRQTSRKERARGGGAQRAGRKRKRRVIVDSSSSSSDDDEDDEGDGVGGSMRNELRAGRQVRQRRGDDGGGDNAGGARRHQEGAVEARGSLGGGGKRGVEE